MNRINVITKLAQYHVGYASYVGEGFQTLFEIDGGQCSIGNFTSIGQGVKVFCGGYHHIDWVTTSPIREDRKSTYTKGDVVIGSDVWIGNGAVIMSGVKIGNGAVVGAFSVVTRNVNDYEIVAGNPARYIRMRFDSDQISALREIAWWEWPEEVVRARQDDLCQPDINMFIEKYRKCPQH